MSNATKLAKNDAYKWARAEMFFGDGAGTRRKLLGAEITQKVQTIPGYEEKFQKFYQKQNFAEHAIKAAKERQRIDHVSFVAKNLKAVVRGRPQDMSPVLIIGIGVAVVLHKTGYDKVLLEKGQKVYRNVKREVKRRQQARNYETYDIPRSTS